MNRISQLSAVMAAILLVIFLFSSCTTPQKPVYSPTPKFTTPATETPAATPIESVSPQPTKTKEPGKKESNNQQTEKGQLARIPKVEVVFVLDTTGSMSGLIAGAQQKIWSIANIILQSEPKPIIKMGLVGYRDVGDQYVTQVYDLTDNMDKVYENLMGFTAGGGGDTPEHVNKALHDALNQIQWSTGKNVLRIIFLVGDSPPHMDYQDGYNYKKLCGEARQRDIIINTIRCGVNNETEQYWREIASLGGGKYASIDQSGGVVATIDTPMDKELADLNRELGTTIVAYGSKDEREGLKLRQSRSEALAPSVQAERAKFTAGSAYFDKKDLVDAVKYDKSVMNEVQVAELPEEMQKMNDSQRKAYLENQAKKREEIKKKIEAVSKKRDQYIQQKLRENKDSFDVQVVSFIKEQAKTKGITLK